ncbi:cysteine hydrolase [Colidextribacter sp. OB.20]|uniref:cysteine hydrolase family protein n=1 Tax=Colidextribacter sp. OB.20 TaxID=2304568 RepID=UPI00136D491D|nr:cysteine hydrolase family protein [Colidextribacter sp. OB.20]NBI11097.1 cysteine hydrolase [Colidextribacter sp. OB.20]
MTLLVIDTQVGITDSRLYRFEALRANIKALIARARERGTEVVYVRHDDGPGTGFSVGDEEFQIFPEFAPLPGEKIFDKTVNSALHPSVGLSKYLADKGEKRLMVVGLQTDFCIDATIKSAFDLGYEIIVPEDTNSTFDNPYLKQETACRYFNDYVWPGRYARCVPMAQALELLSGE